MHDGKMLRADAGSRGRASYKGSRICGTHPGHHDEMFGKEFHTQEGENNGMAIDFVVQTILFVFFSGKFQASPCSFMFYC